MERNSRWVPFVQWLQNQSRSVENDSEDSTVFRATEFLSQGSSSRQLQSNRTEASAAGMRGTSTRAGQPVASDCRAEQRLLDYNMHARQEMSLVLAAPGLPISRAPIVTAKQAIALLKALSQPLLQLDVGRLTRKLSSPSKLQPVAEHGVISLWLLPNDELTLTWQASSLPTDNISSTVGQVTSSVTVWESLVHFPSHCFVEQDEPVAIIHTLRSDASGRSFYIRPRADLMLNDELAGGAGLTNEQACGAGVSAAAPVRNQHLIDASALQHSNPRLYFWLRGINVGSSIHDLGRLKTLLRRPPTLSQRTGIPQKKLEEIGKWFAIMEGAMQQQQQQLLRSTQDDRQRFTTMPVQAGARSPEARQPGQPGAAAPNCSPSTGSGVSHLKSLGQINPAAAPASSDATSFSSRLADGSAVHPTSARMASALSSVITFSSTFAAPRWLGTAERAAGSSFPHGAGLLEPAGPAGVTAALAGTSAGQGAEPPAGFGLESGGEDLLGSSRSTVTAAASALYMDRRFHIVAPVAVAVVATSAVQRARVSGSCGSSLQVQSLEAASEVAQQQAKAALERAGRQMMEQQLAEVVLGTIRTNRSSSKQRALRTQQKEQEQAATRRWRTAIAMPAIRAAAAQAALTRSGRMMKGDVAPMKCPRSQDQQFEAVGVKSSIQGGSCTPPAPISCLDMAEPPPVLLAAYGRQQDTRQGLSAFAAACDGSSGTRLILPRCPSPQTAGLGQRAKQQAMAEGLPPTSGTKRHTPHAHARASCQRDSLCAGPHTGARVTIDNLQELLRRGEGGWGMGNGPVVPATQQGEGDQGALGGQQSQVLKKVSEEGVGLQGGTGERLGGDGLGQDDESHKLSMSALCKLLNECLDV